MGGCSAGSLLGEDCSTHSGMVLGKKVICPVAGSMECHVVGEVVSAAGVVGF